MRLSPASASACAAQALLLVLAGCPSDPPPAPRKDPAPPASAANATASASATPSAVASAAAAPSASAAAAPAGPARPMVLEEFHPGNSHPERVFSIEGALLVSEREKIGRVVDGKVEPVAAIPKETPGAGPNSVRGVWGKYPDRIDVEYHNDNGRAPMPTLMALTGKGSSFTAAPGGGWGTLAGPAVVGESTLVFGASGFTGAEIATIRGPRLTRSTLAASLYCKPGEVPGLDYNPGKAAVDVATFAATGAGTLIAFGPICGRPGLWAEIWDSAGKSRRVEVQPKGSFWPIGVFPGKGDELWAAFSGHPVLHYLDGKLDELPPLDGIDVMTALPGGPLYAATSSGGIHRFENGAWQHLAQLPWPTSIATLAVDGDEIYLSTGNNAPGSNKVYRLIPGASTAFTPACKTPFVFLYEVSTDNDAKFTFPTTRKALSSFSQASEIGLVDFHESGVRRLGLTVPSKEVGEAVMAHVVANMKDEHPKLLCYEPKAPRKIELKTGK